MWIRSQDKEKLLNVNRVYLNGNHIFGSTIDGYDGTLGVYSTKEKALAVLNMIKFSITLQADPKQKKKYIKLMRNDKSYIWQRYTEPVFQMPQDDEVE